MICSCYAVRLLAEHPHRLAFYRQRWKWLVVDEFQDTNEAQSTLVALLAGPAGNVCCVRRRRPGPVLVSRARSRGTCSRSPSASPAMTRSCSAATSARARRSSSPPSRCIAHNERRSAKALIAMRGAGGEVRVIAYGSDRHEADCVAAAIAQALARRRGGRGARARAHRLCDRAGAGRARPAR